MADRERSGRPPSEGADEARRDLSAVRRYIRDESPKVSTGHCWDSHHEPGWGGVVFHCNRPRGHTGPHVAIEGDVEVWWFD
jgi:hypothetical protein